MSQDIESIHAKAQQDLLDFVQAFATQANACQACESINQHQLLKLRDRANQLLEEHGLRNPKVVEMPTPSYQTQDAGSIWLFKPLTDECRTHLEDNTSEEAMWFGGALVVEPRYVEDLINGLANNGFYHAGNLQ